MRSRTTEAGALKLYVNNLAIIYKRARASNNIELNNIARVIVERTRAPHNWPCKRTAFLFSERDFIDGRAYMGGEEGRFRRNENSRRFR